MTHRTRKTGLALSRRSVLGGIGAASAMAITGLPVRAQTLTPVRVTTALRLANYTPAYTALREGIFAVMCAPITCPMLVPRKAVA